MRACTKCGELKPLEAFPPVRRGEAKLQTWCRECFAEANARNYRKNHEREKTRLVRQVAERRAEARERIIEYLRDHPCVDCGQTDIVVLEFDHVAGKLGDISSYVGRGRSWSRVKAEIDKCEVRCANCHRRRTLERAALERPSKVPIQSTAAHVRAPGGSRLTRPVQLKIEAALGVRTCRVCGLAKPVVEFPFRSVTKQTRQSICLSCQRDYTRGWYSRNRKRHIANAAARRNREAIRTLDRVFDYLRNHSCADCGESDTLLLDFDHLRDKRASVKRLARGGLSWDVVEAEIGKCEVRCANCHRRRTAVQLGAYRLKMRPQ